MIAFKMTEWENCGKWYIANTEDIGGIANNWWFPAKILNIPLDLYVKKLVEEYHADITYYEDKNLLLYSFKNLSDLSKYKRWVNTSVRATLRKMNCLK